MVDTAVPSAVFIAIVLSLIPHDIQYGPQAALIAEAFTPRLRYSGSSLDIAACTVISLISAAFMPDYTGKDISMEYDHAA